MNGFSTLIDPLNIGDDRNQLGRKVLKWKGRIISKNDFDSWIEHGKGEVSERVGG